MDVNKRADAPSWMSGGPNSASNERARLDCDIARRGGWAGSVSTPEVVSRTSDMFAIPKTEVDPRKPLTHLVVDSLLLKFRVRNWTSVLRRLVTKGHLSACVAIAT